MRFLEFVPCGCRAAVEPQPLTRRHSAEETAPATEKRRRRRPSTNGAEASWQPSLGSISEDRAASAAAAAAAAATGAKGGATGKAKAGKTVRVIPRYDRDEHGYTGIPAMVPAFAPTVFMF